MRYQLVLQWPTEDSTDDYDTMIGIEDRLIERLAKTSEVDGHDSGSGQTNVFIFTDDPQRTFGEITRILSAHYLWPEMRIAYRGDGSTEYAMLRPEGYRGFSIK